MTSPPEGARVNRRELILETAGRLFIEQGYTATSIRQIAERVGCTEAALYYHFKDGKRALLESVLEAELPSLLNLLDSCQDATSLPELTRKLGKQLAVTGRRRMDKLAWIIGEFPHLTSEERAAFQHNFLTLHDRLAVLIEPFAGGANARAFAWVVISAYFGYGQLFWHLGLETITDFSVDEFIQTLAAIITTNSRLPFNTCHPEETQP
jgi:AcrR family transcriptional regulator